MCSNPLLARLVLFYNAKVHLITTLKVCHLELSVNINYTAETSKYIASTLFDINYSYNSTESYAMNTHFPNGILCVFIMTSMLYDIGLTRECV